MHLFVQHWATLCVGSPWTQMKGRRWGTDGWHKMHKNSSQHGSAIRWSIPPPLNTFRSINKVVDNHGHHHHFVRWTPYQCICYLSSRPLTLGKHPIASQTRDWVTSSAYPWFTHLNFVCECEILTEDWIMCLYGEVKWIQVKTKPSGVKWRQVNQNKAKWSKIKSSEVKWGQVKPSEVKQSQSKPSKVKQIQVKRSEVNWSQVKLNEAKWSQLKSNEAKGSQLCQVKSSEGK